MKRAWLFSVVIGLSVLSTACSKNKCKLDTAEKKAALGALADMTEGAYSCDVEGAVESAGSIEPDMRCEIGAKSCIPSLHAIHPDTTVAVVAPKYKAFLEKAQWTVVEKRITGKFMNGKPFEGTELKGKSGNQTLITRIVPFGDTMVETTSLLVVDSK